MKNEHAFGSKRASVETKRVKRTAFLLRHSCDIAGDSAIPDALADAIGRRRLEVFRFLLLSVRDVDVAKKLTHKCLSVAHCEWFNLPQYTGTSTWLMSIAIQMQKHYWRKVRLMFWRKVSRSLTPLLEDWTLTGRCSSELRAVAQEQVRHVWKAVYAMNDDERTIFLLRFVENFNKSEIAEATGLDDRTVQEYLSLALRRVRSEVHPRMGRH